MKKPEYADCRKGHHRPVGADCQQNGISFTVQAVCEVCRALLSADVYEWGAVYDSDLTELCDVCGEADVWCDCPVGANATRREDEDEC